MPEFRDDSGRAMAAGNKAAAAAAAMRKPSFGTRAWRLLRLAVLWARRGGAAQSLRLLRTLRRHHHSRGDRLRYYGERQYSIDETPAFRFRTPSARVLRLIPCIAPAVPDTPGLFGGGDDDRYFFAAAVREMDNEDAGYRYGADPAGSEIDSDEDEPSCCAGDDEQLLERRAGTPRAGEEDAGVDVKAEEFIARFYAQMKLQRQISWLQYNEMMERSIS